MGSIKVLFLTQCYTGLRKGVLVVLVLCLWGCSIKAPVKTAPELTERYHEVWDLQAIIRHVGPPLPVGVHSNGPTAVLFERRIADVFRTYPNNSLKITRGFDRLDIESRDPLGYSTESIRIVLNNGYEYRLLLKGDTTGTRRAPSYVNVNKKVVEKEAEVASARMQLDPAQAMLSLLQGLSPEQKTDMIPGMVERTHTFEKTLIQSKSVRGTVLRHFESRDAEGFILELANLTDSNLILSPDVLGVDTKKVTVSFSAPIVKERQATTGSSTVYGYLVRAK